MEEIKLGIYRHFKGKLYEVIEIGRDSETLNEVVIYKALYEIEGFGNNSVWIRPKKMFLGDVNLQDKTVPRFEFVKEKD